VAALPFAVAIMAAGLTRAPGGHGKTASDGISNFIWMSAKN
jgi:hypothetical protein